ncbi:ferritin-like domain-containing protein [Hwanghaeella sp.]|uniref:ferritin-like domain-containing protein n=1 Tax=Hwanghaeella sp. TaxID=2605943 RepID=UPI003CCC391B
MKSEFPSTFLDRRIDRRHLVRSFGAATLSGATVALMAGKDSLAAAQTNSAEAVETDIRILNTALGAELEAVAAYQLGAESGLLRAPSLDLAVQFQGHHKEHAEALSATVEKLGGSAISSKSQYDFPTDELTSEQDVLRFAASLEKGAVSAYLGAVPLFADRELSRVSASILGDEAMHWAVLRQALGEEPVPGAFLS